MKKKIIGVAILAAMAVTAGLNLNQNKNEVATDLMLANVEALAQYEGGGQILQECFFGVDNYQGDFFIVKVQCNTCTVRTFHMYMLKKAVYSKYGQKDAM